MADYKGNVDPKSAWRQLVGVQDCVLIDVRTTAEWNFVGIPDLSEANKKVALVEWQKFPTMEINAGFVDQAAKELQSRGAGVDSEIFFLCRSGVRSQAAAAAMTRAGYKNCFNIIDGFEGTHDSNGHRGSESGWKSEDLPWVQN